MDTKTLTLIRDPVELAPEMYRVVLENDRTRVLDITLKPGEVTPMDSHPSYIIYSLGAGKVRFTYADGTTDVMSIKEGDIVWRDPEEHSAENIGKTTVHVLNIEFKEREELE